MAGAADRSRAHTGQRSGGGDVFTVLRGGDGRVGGLPALPDDRTYQLWALSDQPDVPPRSLGLLPQAADGQSQVVTQPTRPGEVAVAITAEPGRVGHPTLPIVWMTELTT